MRGIRLRSQRQHRYRIDPTGGSPMGNMDESTIETGVAAGAEEAADTGQVLHERLKEITCLYEIRRGMGLELSVDEVCEQVFEHLVPAMQFPEMASAVIELDGTAFASRNHSGRVTHSLQSTIQGEWQDPRAFAGILSPGKAIPGAGRAAAYRRGRE